MIERNFPYLSVSSGRPEESRYVIPGGQKTKDLGESAYLEYRMNGGRASQKADLPSPLFQFLLNGQENTQASTAHIADRRHVGDNESLTAHDGVPEEGLDLPTGYAVDPACEKKLFNGLFWRQKIVHSESLASKLSSEIRLCKSFVFDMTERRR